MPGTWESFSVVLSNGTVCRVQGYRFGAYLVHPSPDTHVQDKVEWRITHAQSSLIVWRSTEVTKACALAEWLDAQAFLPPEATNAELQTMGMDARARLRSVLTAKEASL